VLKYLQTKFY